MFRGARGARSQLVESRCQPVALVGETSVTAKRPTFAPDSKAWTMGMRPQRAGTFL